MATVLFDGVAYGMLLFVLAVGLAVTLGLMNFVNLAHGAFAMAGGYVTVLLMQRAGLPFLATLPLDLAPAGHVRLVLGQRPGKGVPARAVGDEIQIGRLVRRQRRLDRRPSDRAERP